MAIGCSAVTCKLRRNLFARLLSPQLGDAFSLIEALSFADSVLVCAATRFNLRVVFGSSRQETLDFAAWDPQPQAIRDYFDLPGVDLPIGPGRRFTVGLAKFLGTVGEMLT